jgi:hypothetical protein
LKVFNKVVALFFLILIFIPMSIGVVWLCHQYYSHYTVKQQLKETHIQTIILAPERMQWIELDEKLLIEGEMFHVQNYILNENGFYLVKGIFNTDENKIYTILSQLFHKQNDQEEDGCMSKVVSFCWGENMENILCNTSCLVKNTISYSNHYSFATPVYFKNVLIPPPKI